MVLQYFEQFCKKFNLSPAHCSSIVDSFNYTSGKNNIVRTLLKQRLKDNPHKGKFCIVAVGSYGRFEASQQSDLDGYVIYQKELSSKIIDSINSDIKAIAQEQNLKFSSGFESISLDNMHRNIGGKDDTNASITIRILFLLESQCLYGDTFYKKAYLRILKKYLEDVLTFNKSVPRFLINDVMRYYRTICVDYEYKVTEEGKDWATRNIKLRFSRKGLYFGGITILLNSLNRDQSEKFEYVSNNLRLPFADKISHILLEQNKEKDHIDILTLYSEFLSKMSSEDVRKHLKKLKKTERDTDEVFCDLVAKARSFNVSLRELLVKGKWNERNYIDFLVL